MSRGTRSRPRWWLVAIVAASVGVAGCAGSNSATIDVFAASSMTTVLDEVLDQFEADNPDVDVRVTLAGSATLQAQLRDGADADSFISASVEIVDELVADGTIDNAGTVIATNAMVLAAPSQNPAGVSGLDDLANPDLFIGLCAQGVPCGDLARSILDTAGIEPTIDTETTGVRALALALADGELDAALVYVSDVIGLAGEIAEVPTDITATNSYPLVVLNDDAIVADFADLLAGPTGRQILSDAGFVPA